MTRVVVAGEDNLAKKRLAKFLKQLRGKATQRQFAKQLGTSYTALQDWEKQIRLPNNESLKRIAQLKGWTHEELVRHVFCPDTPPEIANTDLLETIVAYVQHLSPTQMQTLSDYLKAQLGELPNVTKNIERCLSGKQKHNLHLLLRASLKVQDLTEAVERSGIEPGLFTDVFLRDDENRVVRYEELEQFSSLCCQIIQWTAQLPEVNPNQTYLGQTELLFNDLSEKNRAVVS